MVGAKVAVARAIVLGVHRTDASSAGANVVVTSA
jgi:hypothetical protein